MVFIAVLTLFNKGLLGSLPSLRHLRRLSPCLTERSMPFWKQKCGIASGGHDDAKDYVEGIVCGVDELQENEMKICDLGEGHVLLVKQKGIINALGTKCTHYGAPLVKSALSDGRVRCQWHGACFNLATGDIEDFPGLDSLPCYKVTIENNKIKVRARKSDLKENKRKKPMLTKNKKETKHIVVIGGGPSAATCVEVLRQEGFEGQITLVCKENALPYDRVKVSKMMDMDVKKVQFRTDQFYKEHGIDVLKGVDATAVDVKAKTVTLCNKSVLHYDSLYVATGSRPRKLNIPGADLKNVMVLRSFTDGNRIEKQLSKDKEVVILGSSFIALEVANYCSSSEVKKVTIVARDSVPLKPVLGERIGAAVLKMFLDKGVNFVPNSGVKAVIDNGCGVVSQVELTDGKRLKADIFIMGVGSEYNTELLKDTGVTLTKNGSVEANEYLQTNVENVYVGGDIANAPVWSHHNTKAAIGHFSLAHYHGKIAALNILNKRTPLRTVPYFYTMLFGKGIRYAGHGTFTDIIYDGDVEDFKFVAFYLNRDEVVAVSSCGMDPIVSQFAELLAQGKKLERRDLKDDVLKWRSWILP